MKTALNIKSKFLKSVLLSTLFLFSLILNLSFAKEAFAQNESSIWEIQDFEATLRVSEDGDLKVTEKIEANFFIEKHGIYRDIPTDFNGDNKWIGNYISIDVKSVKNQDGKKWMYETSTGTGYKRIKIGDPDKYISGEQTYIIEYEIKHGATFYDDYQEIYWNSTGNQWPVEILKARSQIILPEKVDPDDIEALCFTGSYLSTETNCTIEKSDNVVKVNVEGQLYINEGLTTVVTMPKGTITEPTTEELLLFIAALNACGILPVLVAIALYLYWRKHGKDAKGRGTIVPQYDAPKDLRPAEVGVIIDNTADNLEISSTVIDLAIKGYIQIKELKKKKYSFILKNNDLSDLKAYEIKLLDGIFGKADIGTEVELSSLKNTFFTTTAVIKEMLFKNLVTGAYYSRDPKELRGSFIFGGVAFIAFAIIFSIFSSFYFPYTIGSICGLLLSGIIFFLFSVVMPQVTEKGAEMKEYILGLKDYIQTAEKDRLEKMQGADSEYVTERTNEPKKTVELFEKLLPYAMVLKVEKSWADKFKDIYTQAPDWYSGSNWNSFNTGYLISSLNNATDTINSTFVSQPSSSSSGSGGGGFSGGGFGGGGGGSW